MTHVSSATITISVAHSVKRALAGKRALEALGYEDATILDAQLVFNDMMYVPGASVDEHSMEEQVAFETRLLMLIAKIRDVTGVGHQPMLTELAASIEEKIESTVDAARREGFEMAKKMVSVAAKATSDSETELMLGVNGKDPEAELDRAAFGRGAFIMKNLSTAVLKMEYPT
jgi:hypothetical protein